MPKGEKERAIGVWGESPAGTAHADGAIPGTRGYFERVREKRKSYEIPWLFELVPFSSFRDKSVLELGCGAGYDAFEFCHSGADYIGMDITSQGLALAQEHLSHFGYNPALIRGDVEDLPFKKEIFDIVFSNGVLHHTPDTERSFLEASRVLKMRGEFWVILYHKNSIFYWLKLFLLDHLLRFGFRVRSFKERLSMIEQSKSPELPLVKAYSRTQLKGMLCATGFEVTSIWVRKLLKEDLPDVPILRKMWRFIPLSWLHSLGKSFGWYLIARSEKN